MSSPPSAILSQPLQLRRGRPLPNRFVLAPLTNNQNQMDGSLGDADYDWLIKRAEGGFGALITAAAYVNRQGRAWLYQLGVDRDDQIDGLRRLASGIAQTASLGIVQLHHGGGRCPAETVTDPVAPSPGTAGPPPFDDAARALTTDEVVDLREDFISAVVRCERAGFDGVELHGAHSYILCAFLSPRMNRRDDRYGGSFENRSRLLYEIIDGIRERCSDSFVLGVRLSPEGYGLRLAEMLSLAGDLLVDERIDFLDVSLWDSFATPKDPAYRDTTLAELFATLPRDQVALGFAGKLYSSADLDRLMEMAPVDYVLLGRAAIVQHDIPRRIAAGEPFEMKLPVTVDQLHAEAVSDRFIEFMRNYDGFVAD